MKSTNLAFVSKTQAKVRSERGVNALRVTRVALGDVLTCAGVAALSPLATGCLVALVKFICAQEFLESHGSCISAKGAQGLFAMKGLSCGDCELVLSALQIAGLTYIEGENVGIHSVDRAIQDEVSALSNRVAGWRKRGAALVVTESRDSAADPVLSGGDLATEKVLLEAPSLSDAISEAPKKERSPIKKSAPATTRRFSAKQGSPTDPDSDPVMVRLLCEGEKVAEITNEYVQHLQSNFRNLDVLVTLKRAALWCESNPSKRKTFTGIRRFVTSWLTRADSEVDVRMAVVRGGNQKNGFGQGGDYAEPSMNAEKSPIHESTSHVGDDFLDLFNHPPAIEQKTVELVDSIQPTPAQIIKTSFVPRPFISRAVIAARANATPAHGVHRISASHPEKQTGTVRQR